MFEKLKAMFRRNKPEQPKATSRLPEPTRCPPMPWIKEPRRPSLAATETKRDDSNDLLSPLNPMGLTSPISPLNPLSPIWHGSSSASTSNDCGSSSSYSSSSSDSGSSSSSYDSGSSSSCDSGSSSW